MKKTVFTLLFFGLLVISIQSCKDKTQSSSSSTDTTTTAPEQTSSTPASTASPSPTTFKKHDLHGKWISTEQLAKNDTMGFDLKSSGKAASIGMASLTYSNWVFNEDEGVLYINGMSEGSGSPINSIDTMKIVSLDKNNMSVTFPETDSVYNYQKIH